MNRDALGTIYALAPRRAGERWSFVVLGCTCAPCDHASCAPGRHATLSLAEACAQRVMKGALKRPALALVPPPRSLA